ncbi:MULTISPECIES: ABC transporter permease subunit [Fictibacillus]|uniref:ABC transporter permease subunit n=1 Tax=Fictibacillus TaxID=1329200 RepID=UPI0010299538|nr:MULTISPECIES: ABC transporter permease subunit [Fictibacillus]RZT24187.1 peptide/nickel transport system permease protein [Fictibacillus sp. BK138]
MMRLLWKLVLFLLLSLTGIILFTSLPVLIFDYAILMNNTRLIDTGQMTNNSFLVNSIVFQPLAYWDQIKTTVIQLTDITNTTFYNNGINKPLLPMLMEVYPQSISFLIGGLFLSLLFGITFTILYMNFPVVVKNFIKKCILAIETLPDVFVILLVQLAVIWIYKNTGLLMFNIVNVYKTKAYFLPTLAISILPTLYVIKYLILTMEEESTKIYVEFAKGKGLKKIYILLAYLLKNTAAQLFGQLKNIFWILLSNLLMLEIIFNIYGITRFVADYGVENPHLAAISLIAIFLPFFVLFAAGSLLIRRLDPR